MEKGYSLGGLAPKEGSRIIVKLKIAEHLELAKGKEGDDRVRHLEAAIYLGCKDLEIFMDVLRWLMDVGGDARKAYSIAVLAPRSREVPLGATRPSVYQGEFDAYWALAAYHAGFYQEAYRIQKNLIFYGPRAYNDQGWLDRNYLFYLDKINTAQPIPVFINSDKQEESEIAILFIGQYRTFDRTYYNTYRNLILPNKATVFILCECDKDLGELVKVGKKRWGDQTIGGCAVVGGRPPSFKHLEDYLLKTKIALHPDNFRGSCATPHYITESGSIIEYWYYSKCYDLMLQYERKHKIKFNIIIRSRLDIFVGPCMRIRSFFSEIDSELRKTLANDSLYLACLGNPRIKNIREPIENRGSIANLLEEINSEKYIWTFGPNQVWIGKRSVMSQLCLLAYTYGSYISQTPNPWSSEMQFHHFCRDRGIHHIILEAGDTAEKHIRSRSTNLSLLKQPTDILEDTTIIWGFLRPSTFYFPEP